MAAQAHETAVTTYNEFAQPLSDALEMLGFAHKDTFNDVEQWEKATRNGSTEVSIDYISGEVVVTKYLPAKGDERARRLDSKTFTLRTRSHIEMAARAAV